MKYYTGFCMGAALNWLLAVQNVPRPGYLVLLWLGLALLGIAYERWLGPRIRRGQPS